MLDKAMIAAACSINDVEATAKGLQKVCEGLGIDCEGLIHVAHQRAMRAIVISKGKKMPQQGEPFPIHPSEAEEVTTLTAMFLDAFTTGVRSVRNTYQNGQRRIKGTDLT